ncbi:hypothetical protein BFW01_g90 [Lasiodiplodia theobromae]|uniref:Uncharacterized protein n=1 Tax=Lasiodiplodia theobromae TaxID=45133 RepID=A0A5N5CY60_9PEZI|nr:Amylopullulanase [Lasiodiplodia theobromae]KAB2570305.1 hypothetical protein DBV05_g11011 [Lasiodiplodia theobromae]KAF4534857.1 Amylopullulanase [Lasiodiplodia theobromae]KAF9629909.1 hypothetical protein BFW01_g90 [Lasiodiplodia theobromae]
MLAEAEISQIVEVVEQGHTFPGAWPTDARAENSEALFDGLVDSFKPWWGFHGVPKQNIARPDVRETKKPGTQDDDDEAINPDMQLGLGLAINQIRDEASIIGSDKRIDSLME